MFCHICFHLLPVPVVVPYFLTPGTDGNKTGHYLYLILGFAKIADESGLVLHVDVQFIQYEDSYGKEAKANCSIPNRNSRMGKTVTCCYVRSEPRNCAQHREG